jgi:hypothetical protein
VGEYLPDDEEAGVCSDCFEDLVAAKQFFRELSLETGSEQGDHRDAVPGFIDDRPN